MKILLLSPAHPLRGGIAASSERLAQELQTAGHEVVIYSFSLQYPAFLFPGKSQFSDDPPPPGLVIKTRLNSINPFNWPVVGREIAREQPDRIIVRFWLPFMGPCLGTVLRVARWFARKKPHVTALVDNIIPHEKRPGDRLFARYFVRACDDFVVMSRSVGEEIRQFLPGGSTPPPTPPPEGRRGVMSSSELDENGSTAPLPSGGGAGGGVVRFAPHPLYDTYGEPVGKAVARRELGVPEGVPLVLFFGFIRAYKGLDLLLEALAETSGVHALVAGECYEDWQPYQAILEKNNLIKRVHLHTDFIPADRVRLYFSAADLVVQPYRSATQSGISQIAYHFEKPMVVTRVGGLPEIVTDRVSGYVVAPEAGAIAAAVRDFFERRRADAMAAGVRAEKGRFSWENLVKVLLDG
ncbi:MAG: glycosyltransferase [Saprospiraceae bacterium]|jgi:D-inositol-3-phosphate glycosyltransferase|nr:glycosyltransferase [Saprospiraceae bacterium]